MGIEAPSYPWKKGKQEDYTCFVLEVEVCQDKEGDLWCHHGPQSSEDEAIAKGMKSGGLEQAAHALVAEAIKRESLLQLLVRMTNDPAIVAKIQKNIPKEMEDLSEEIVRDMLRTFQEALGKLGPPSAQAALSSIRQAG